MRDNMRSAKKKLHHGSRLLMFKSSSSVGANLDQLDAERSIYTDPAESHKRRTLQLHKINDSWGFTLQTYGIRHKKTNEVEVMTYIDYVDINGAAYVAGMRRGDVIVSVNGQSMEQTTHTDIVAAIKRSGETLRLVVMFEDCCHKVELHDRIIRLKAILTSKLQEFKALEMEERKVLDGICDKKGIDRFNHERQSIISSASSSSWDTYSLVTSSKVLKHHPSIPSSAHGRIGLFHVGGAGADDSNSYLDSSMDGSLVNLTYADSISSDNDSNLCCSYDSADSRLDSLHNSRTNIHQSDFVHQRQDSGIGTMDPRVGGLHPPTLLGMDFKKSPKTTKRSQNGDIFTNAEIDRDIKIPFLYLTPVHINEKDEVTKL